MANFEVYGRCEVRKADVSIDALADLVKGVLTKYYDERNIAIDLFDPTLNDGANSVWDPHARVWKKLEVRHCPTSACVTVNGNLKASWERAITKAEVELRIEGDQFSYRVDGSSSLGGWAWVRFLLGFVTGFFFGWFMIDVVTFLISRDRPKKYFEDVFKAVQFEIG